MPVSHLYGSGLAEVDAGAGRHDRSVGEDAVDGEGVGDGVEGSDDSAKGFQRREGVHRSMIGYQSAYLEERGWMKY